MEEQSLKIKNFDVVNRLIKTIESNKKFDPSKSYVGKLFHANNDLILKKFGEEAVEFILAAKGGSKKELISETADLFFHLLVALEFYGVELDDVFVELQKREGTSGIKEKNERG